MKIYATKRAVLILAGVLAASVALAARGAKVGDYGAEVRDGPGTKYRLLQNLKKGTEIVASNFPTEGFHKVRLPDGTTGWVLENSLVLKPLPAQYSGKPPSSPASNDDIGPTFKEPAANHHEEEAAPPSAFPPAGPPDE